MEINICKRCSKLRPIVNRTHFICDDCNQIRLHGKTRVQRQLDKSSIKRVNRKRMRVKPRKSTGEAELFKEIWSEREHICHNCRIPLGDEMKTFFFMHMKSKGAHGKLRLVKSNIELGCYDCHTAYDRIGIDNYNSRKDLYAC